MAMGIVYELNLKQGEIVLEPSDCLLVFTDGLDEAANPQEEIFGLGRGSQWLATS